MALTDLQNAMITTLSRSPEKARALKREHQRQPDGHCGVCRSGNFQGPRVVHPCTLFTIASLALAER